MTEIVGEITEIGLSEANLRDEVERLRDGEWRSGEGEVISAIHDSAVVSGESGDWWSRCERKRANVSIGERS
jgi:hypothetical protein